MWWIYALLSAVFAALTAILAKLVNGWPMQKLDELLPWAWADQNRARLAA